MICLSGHSKRRSAVQKIWESEKEDAFKKEGKDVRKKRLRKRKKKNESDHNANKNEYDKALGRLKGQLSRFRQEQALIMAYDAEGWKGASREKIKPHAEIHRAKKSINRCKETIRECIKVCDEAGGDKRIPPEHFDSEGELDFDKIFCAKCLKTEATDDNDIILCDGFCDRAYHLKCVVPIVDLSKLDDDEGWLCPACDRKIDMIDDINDEFGTDYDYEDNWEKILLHGDDHRHRYYDQDNSSASKPFQLSNETSLLHGADLPSDEDSDEDYRCAGPYNHRSLMKVLMCDDIACHRDGTSEHDDSSSASHSSAQEGSKSNESDSLVSERLDNGIEDVETEALEEIESFALANNAEIYTPSHSDSPKIIEGKRKRPNVDYRALNEEMFGEVESPHLEVNAAIYDTESDDDDSVWSPSRKTNRKK